MGNVDRSYGVLELGTTEEADFIKLSVLLEGRHQMPSHSRYTKGHPLTLPIDEVFLLVSITRLLPTSIRVPEYVSRGASAKAPSQMQVN